MTGPRDIVFLVNLLQDVNILRGLVYLTLRETNARVRFLVSEAFVKRDKLQIWQKELSRIARDARADIHVFGSAADVQAVLQGRGGVMIAASESNLNAHRETHEAFRIAPASFVKITLQHGLECVGFLQSREHIVGHGRNISFNADILCSWQSAPHLTAMPAAERSKLYVTGPPTLLQRYVPHPDHPPQQSGIICENMHSVRLQATGDHKASFMDIFFSFCARMAEEQRDVTLRPHPGGQYMLRNDVSLPDNVLLNNLPIYNVNLAGYDFGISAPSTVVLDMVLAGIPVAVWRDPEGIMDAGNYDGLTEISGLEDWLSFARAAQAQPALFRARQRQFLARLGMLSDADEIYRRFARLLNRAVDTRSIPGWPSRQIGNPTPAPVDKAAPAAAKPVSEPPVKRVLFLANDLIPTLQLSFLKPLLPYFSDRRMSHKVLTEKALTDAFGKDRYSPEAVAWFSAQIRDFAPDLIVACRYSGPHARVALRMAQKLNIPLVYHVDDDLLNIPIEIGAAKHKAHNNPKRLEAVSTLLAGATLVYCSTPALKRRFRVLGFTTPMVEGQIYCASRIYRPATPGPVRRIGYMGFDHAHDFETALPALEIYLDANPAVEFELFGSIPMPDSLKRFGARVQTVPPVRNYQAFRQELADREWDFGICPLAYTPFNSVKANTKWVEYTSSGMAVIATRGMVYDDCAGEGRGLLVSPDEWGAAFDLLTDDCDLRYRMTLQAQVHLAQYYSDDRLRAQILDVFARAQALRAAGGGRAAELSRRCPPVEIGPDGLLLAETGA